MRGLLHHPRLAGLGGTLGQLFFVAGTAFWVSRTTSHTAVAEEAAALAGAAMVIFVPAALMTAVYWRSLRVDAAAPLNAS